MSELTNNQIIGGDPIVESHTIPEKKKGAFTGTNGTHNRKNKSFRCLTGISQIKQN